jgi:hypothetical protein
MIDVNKKIRTIGADKRRKETSKERKKEIANTMP